jgi:hypothetical protein
MDEPVRAATIRTLHKRIREANAEIARLQARLDSGVVQRVIEGRGDLRRRREVLVIPLGDWVEDP